MKKSRKSLIAWTLAVLMALTCGSGAAFANETAQPAVSQGNEGLTAVIKGVNGDDDPAFPGETTDYILEVYDTSGKVIEMDTSNAEIKWDVKLYDEKYVADTTHDPSEYVTYERDAGNQSLLHFGIKEWVEERKIVEVTATVSAGDEWNIVPPPPRAIVLSTHVDKYETAEVFAAVGSVISINDLKPRMKRYNKEFPQGTVVDECSLRFLDEYNLKIEDDRLPLEGAKVSSDGKTLTIPKVKGGGYVVCIYADKGTSDATFYAPIYVGNGAFKLSTTNYTYSGGEKKPSISVIDADGMTVPSSNYTVSYPSGRKSVGTYKVTVKFKGDMYSGSGAAYFNINPKGTSIYRVSKARKAFTVKWKRQSSKMATSRITGYQIRYSTSSKMTGAKAKTVKGYKYTSKKVTRLKAKTKYYVQVRTYKTVSGKNYFSSWSGVKSVRTR